VIPYVAPLLGQIGSGCGFFDDSVVATKFLAALCGNQGRTDRVAKSWQAEKRENGARVHVSMTLPMLFQPPRLRTLPLVEDAKRLNTFASSQAV